MNENCKITHASSLNDENSADSERYDPSPLKATTILEKSTMAIVMSEMTIKFC
jgi:hypothetical protein